MYQKRKEQGIKYERTYIKKEKTITDEEAALRYQELRRKYNRANAAKLRQEKLEKGIENKKPGRKPKQPTEEKCSY